MQDIPVYKKRPKSKKRLAEDIYPRKDKFFDTPCEECQFLGGVDVFGAPYDAYLACDTHREKGISLLVVYEDLESKLSVTTFSLFDLIDDQEHHISKILVELYRFPLVPISRK